jgi:hypothetical protein
MAVAEVVVDVESGDHAGDALARLVHGQQLGDDVAQGVDARVGAGQRRLRHGVVQHALGDRMPLGVVGVEQRLR